MADFRLKLQGDAFHVIGAINERADFAPILKFSVRPTQLNFQGSLQISSNGAMLLRNLVLGLPPGALQFLECPPFLVETFNMIPDLTRLAGHEVDVVSVYVPYTCEACRISTDVLKKIADVKVTNGSVKLGNSRCHQCLGPMTLVVDPNDYFNFLL